jgi:hypothetical protein
MLTIHNNVYCNFEFFFYIVNISAFLFNVREVIRIVIKCFITYMRLANTTMNIMSLSRSSQRVM